jgi:hypothetical protein
MNNHTKGIEFEKHCMNLLRQLGFTSVERTGRSGDQGADILGTYGNTRYVFQCKDHGRIQGNWCIQEVIGSKSIYKASRAGVISRTGFSPRALDLARANYCLPLTSHDLEAAIAKNESFDSIISAYTFPPPLQLEHDFDAIKQYEEVKRRVGRVPKRRDFDPTTLRYIERKYGGLRKLILSLSDVPFTMRPTDEIIAKEYKRVRQVIGRVPTLEDMGKHSEFSRNCFHSYPFTRLQRECGDRPYKELGLDKKALREAYEALQGELGRPPSRNDLDERGKYRSSSYCNLWGTWGSFLREKGIPVIRGIPKRFTKEEFVVLYVLVNKLLEIHRHGNPPETWAVRHALLFEGNRVISQKWSENLFENAEDLKQALGSEKAQTLKRALDDLIKACLSSTCDEVPDERMHKNIDAEQGAPADDPRIRGARG